MRSLIFLILLLSGLFSCTPPSPNLTDSGVNILEINQIYIGNMDLAFKDTIYVPIYSDIYTKSTSEKLLLAATLSIRNTSYRDSIFINDIYYYNSKGDLIRDYLQKPIFIGPMGSIEYVIEKDDKEGGTGANFIINWAAHRKLNPVFESVMITTSGQHGISFTSRGVSTSERKAIAPSLD
jgi:hypothetical protein